MRYFANRYVQFLIDIFLIALSFGMAHLLRFEGVPEGMNFKYMIFQWPYVMVLTIICYIVFGINRRIWRYVNLGDAKIFALCHGVVALILLACRIGLPDDLHYGRVPFSIIAINFALVFLFSLGVRVLRRILAEWDDRRHIQPLHGDRPRRRVLLIGAGRAGTIASRELADRLDLGIDPVGFVDDDPQKVGRTVNGLRVYGTVGELPELVQRLEVEELLITVASLSGLQMQRIKGFCDKTGLSVKIIPGMYELLDGTFSVSRIRHVEPEDLLGRKPVELDLGAIRDYLYGRRVLVTGAGGSIGREMCRQVCRFTPGALIMVEQAENNLFEIDNELKAQHPSLSLRAIIADILDAKRMEAVFIREKPEVVIHAAAHKHVPLMEANPTEALKNNIFGTRTVADLAARHGVAKFIMISTDKAVNPSSIMGASKRVAELYIQSLNRRSTTEFIAVRFGNVLGSTGSVIPIFKEQIRNGGPVTVTHPDMKRYFMSIPEAAQLVLQAAALGVGGEIFILDMGEPVRIVTLAEEMIRFSGFKPYEEIPIVFTGVRPGEKLFEELSVQNERLAKTKHTKIFVGHFEPMPYDSILKGLATLQNLGEDADRQTVRTILNELVPEARFLN